jgi:hypothetical protein
MKKRSFKMATAFAGAAAAAAATAMGLGPTALAATARPASHTGSIRNLPCTKSSVNGINHWVHLYYPSNSHVSECFGYVGKTTARATISGECSGNNLGKLFLSGILGSVPLQAKGHSIAHFRLPVVTVTKVSIKGWTGHSSCTGWHPS